MTKKQREEIERRVEEELAKERLRKKAIMEGTNEIVGLFMQILERCETSNDVQNVYDWLNKNLIRQTEEKYAELFNLGQVEWFCGKK